MHNKNAREDSDNLYRLTSVTFPGSRTVSYGYDDASRRTSITYPGGSNQVSYGYDNIKSAESVTDWNSNSTTYAYDDAGRMTTATLPSGTGIVSTYSYDDADRLTNIAHVKGGSTTIASVAYTLDQVGNRTERVDQQGTHTYSYDDLYRLTSVVYPGPSTTSYVFDAFGNRTSMTVAGNTTTYAYDDNDRITSVTPPSPASVINYTWDDNGDLTARGSDSFSWDYEDRMVSATVNSVTTTFAYRGDGLRDSRSVSGGASTTFTWDIAGGLPVVLDDGNQYLYGAGLTAQKQSGSWYYYLADGLGSTMAVVNASGVVQDSYTYDVYGKPTKTGSLGNEFDFAGQQTDGTGLQYLRARYMDPATGTFLSREPLAVGSRWLGNSTGYGAASPSRFRDPTGLFVTEEGVGGGPTIVTEGDWGLDGDGLWLDLYPDSNGKLNLRACGFKTAGGPEIAEVECSSGIFAGGFVIAIGEYCSLSFDNKEQNFALACSRRGSDAPPETRATAHVDAPNGSSAVDLCVEGAIGTVILAKGAGGPEGWAIEAGSGCAAGILAHLVWDNVRPW